MPERVKRIKRVRRPRKAWSRRRWIGAASTAALTAMAIVALVFYGEPLTGALLSHISPDRVALRHALAAPSLADLKPGYEARHYRPVWIAYARARPETAPFVARLASARRDGLEAQRYTPRRLTAALNALPRADRPTRASADVALSRAFADYVADLHAPVRGADMTYTDPSLTHGRPTPGAAFTGLATAKTLKRGLADATRMNPLYRQYRKALADLRANPARDPALERLIMVNLERVRALPVDLGPRFVLVDAASGKLTLYEGEKPVDTMKVVVGTPRDQTPAMVGMIRYAMFNPYWNVPPDLTRVTYAPKAAASVKALDALHMDVWSNYTADARKLDARSVDWTAVARGHNTVWLRQRPGPDNFMGAVKFMLPNTLGIYLHDSPAKYLFAADQRTFSAGCIRVEDYKRLAKWLYKGASVGPHGDTPDQRINLPDPVPVYITYLTAAPGPSGIQVRKDVYNRDTPLLAQLTAAPRAPAGPPPKNADDHLLRKLTPAAATAM